MNNSGYTAAQWAAINSGITQVLVGKLSNLPTADELTTLLNGKQNVLTFDNVPTSGSNNPVKSGGLYELFAAIDAKLPSDASANNKLVAENRLAAYVGGIIGALDATFDLTSADGHVTFKMTQADGVITSVQILTSDIASAAALTTLGGQVSTNASDIAALQALYNALQQSAPQIIEPTDTWPVANPSDTVIYRVIDRVNMPPEYYSDYMYNGTTMVLMATYNNAIDPRPKKGSANLVTSGGVFDNIGALDISELNATGGTLATYATLDAALAAIPSDYQKGGMSIKFVHTSDNKYVQHFCKAQSFTTDTTYWEKTNLEEEVSQLGQEADENTEAITGIITVVKSTNLLNPAACVLGYIDATTGDVVASSDRYASDFILVSEAGLYCNAYSGYGVAGRAAVYDENKAFLRYFSSNVYTYQAGDAYVRWTLDKTKVETPTAYIIKGTSSGEYTPYSAPKYFIKAEGIQEGTIINSMIASNTIAIDKIAFKHIVYGANRLDPSACSAGYINMNTGAFVANSDRLATDFIPVSTNGLYCYIVNWYGVIGKAAVYDINQQYLRGLDSPAYTYQDGDAFVRWTLDNRYLSSSYVIEGTQPGTYVPYTPPKKEINQENIPEIGTNNIANGAVTLEKLAPGITFPATLPAISLCGKNAIKAVASSIAAGGSLQITDFPQYLKANGVVSFSAKLTTFNELFVGFGNGDTNSIQVKIDGTNVQIVKSGSQTWQAFQWAHGLTISDFIDVTFNNDWLNPKIVVATKSGIFVQAVNQLPSLEMYGLPTVVMGSGTSVTNAELRATSDKFNKPIWVFGDSYTSLYTERWTYQMMKNIGIENFLICGLAGGGSNGLYADLQKALAFGTPKYLIWCLGMNDSYEAWNAKFELLKPLCASMGTELILQTIPIPNLETSSRQVAINAAIRTSGYRYIDACDAMCPNNTYPWYTGYCADGVHPTELGAKVLAARFLSDFPEFMQQT
uniref:Ester hydrolase n=1 Tax=uncultured prokaryote TaxID=198431 RepID=Q335P4_9ZZZZ|nr:ester hydrolase [uncultured prokaryote]